MNVVNGKLAGKGAVNGLVNDGKGEERECKGREWRKVKFEMVRGQVMGTFAVVEGATEHGRTVG